MTANPGVGAPSMGLMKVQGYTGMVRRFKLYAPHFWAVVVLAGLILPPLLTPAGAFDQLELEIAALTSPDWRAEQLHFTLDWGSAAQAGYRLEIGRLALPGLKQSFSGVKIDCRRGEIGDLRISCKEAAVILPYPLLDRSAMTLNFELDRRSGKLSGRLGGMAIAGGLLDLDFTLDAGAWQLRARGKGLKLEALAKLWPPAQSTLKGWSLTARATLDARLSGRDDALQSASWQCDLSALSLADQSGS
jgi:hypothetical protein